MYTTWSERNQRLFHDKGSPINQLVSRIFDLVRHRGSRLPRIEQRVATSTSASLLNLGDIL